MRAREMRMTEIERETERDEVRELVIEMRARETKCDSL